ncbi:MAG: dihydroneopterin aldolase [Candidatus Eremiobacteraeota bacterium]|nr:dihydroneopterin aldolase [Candidatus Eremiobacteraeota bacterium]MBV8366585.1 dihydroneopterin aldolase [Candidatus Eremiobacteraeota bacterium]
MADVIRIRGMRFQGQHGVLENERAIEQPIDVELDVTLDGTPAATSDRIADAVDYRELYAKCEATVTKQSHALLEALAAACLESILTDKRIRSATIRLRKPHILDGATPEVELTRTQR